MIAKAEKQIRVGTNKIKIFKIIRILCLIAFIFLTTSFTTNNENFEKVSNSENLEIIKPTEKYRVTAFTKENKGNGGYVWKKSIIKISVIKFSDRQLMTVVAFYALGHWFSTEEGVFRTNSVTDGEDAASRFEYKAGNYYFNF